MRMPLLPPFEPRFLHPRYWLTWCGLGAWALTAQLPYRWQMFLGDRLGDLIRLLARSRARITRINLDLCYPEKTPQQRAELLNANFRSVGRAFLEISFTWWARPKTLASLCHISGVEHLEKARAQGRGVMLLTSHMTPLEVAAYILGTAWPHCALMYKDYDNPVFEWVSQRKRLRYMAALLPHKQVTAFLASIKAGGVGIYMMDQSASRRHCVFAPFFGIPTATLKTTGDFVRQTGAVAIPTFFGRLPGGRGYYVDIQPPLLDFPSEDSESDATRLNALTEANIQRHPEQYLWQHRRFKHRPEGEPAIY